MSARLEHRGVVLLIDDEADLRQKIGRIAASEDPSFDLVHESGRFLQIGIFGSKAAFVFVQNPERDPPYLCARPLGSVPFDSEELTPDGEVPFVTGGQITPQYPDECISFDDMVEAARTFAFTGLLSPVVRWVEI